MDDILKDFLVESNDNLDQLDRDFVALEQDPTNKELLSGIFRVIHTIKGTCGFLGFSKLESVTHVGENLLSKLRDGAMVLNPEMAGVLLKMVDAVREIIRNIESTEKEGDGDYGSVVDSLKNVLNGNAHQKVKQNQKNRPPNL